MPHVQDLAHALGFVALLHKVLRHRHRIWRGFAEVRGQVIDAEGLRAQARHQGVARGRADSLIAVGFFKKHPALGQGIHVRCHRRGIAKAGDVRLEVIHTDHEDVRLGGMARHHSQKGKKSQSKMHEPLERQCGFKSCTDRVCANTLGQRSCRRHLPMNADHKASPPPPEPTRWSALVFLFKARCFQIKRWLQDLAHPVTRYSFGEKSTELPLTADWSSDLWSEGASPRERKLQLGKVQNLRIAAQVLNGLEIPAGGVWSFWKHLGRTSVAKGYSIGRELREGCLVPQIGGGLCQLSGALYNAALEAGLEIVERHPHSNSTVGSLARIGRDATVFWNYVDLRLRHPSAWRLEVHLDKERLHIRIRSDLKRPPSSPITHEKAPSDSPLNTCSTCGIESCFRSSPLQGAQASVDRIAVLVDAWWPEWEAFLNSEQTPPRDLLLPLDGKRWGKTNYQWDTTLYSTSRAFTWLALKRAWETRGLRNEGARRQQVLLQWDERLAHAYGRALDATHSHVLISQTLLPYLWRDGWLGGRTFDVLMTRLPLTTLHARLDHAATLHPTSHTCADFRAPDDLLRHETEALAAANRWITPHSEIAKLGGKRAVHLPWTLPVLEKAPFSTNPRKRIVFPASTLCRKGGYELRDALADLPVELELKGGVLEGADFWQDLRLSASSPDWLDEADVIVLPAFVEHCPRLLLKAIAAGKPVIASKACGLEGLPGVTEIDAGHVEQLRTALIEQLAGSSTAEFATCLA